MTNLVYKSWMEGGTGITNFNLNELDLYKEAVRQYGDLGLIVSDKPMPPMGIGGSLHYTYPRLSYAPVDLSQFWNIHRELKKNGWTPQTNVLRAYDRAMGVVGRK